METKKYIICDPAVCGGDPVFKGTRIPVYIVLDLIEGGVSVSDILSRYYPQLSEDAIKAAIHYASEIIKSSEFIPFNPVEA
jgi:uncharacterized protein (DUF433 family)